MKKQKSKIPLTRKEQRREDRKQKKQRIKNYHDHKHVSAQAPQSSAQTPRPSNHPTQHHIKISVSNTQNISRKGSKVQENSVHHQVEQSMKKKQTKTSNSVSNFGQDQKEIQQLQRKLGIFKQNDKKLNKSTGKVGKNKSYSKIAKSMGCDDDLFDFLQSISKKVKGAAKEPYQQNAPSSQEDLPLEEFEEPVFSQEEEQMSAEPVEKKIEKKKNKLKQTPRDEALSKRSAQIGSIKQLKKEKKKRKQQEKGQLVNQQNILRQPKSTQLLSQNPKEQPDLTEIRKSMTSLLNKLSEGNLLLTFKQFMKVFESYSKAQTIPIFCEIFIRFNVMIEKPLFHVFLTNVALLVGIHQVIGNRLMAPLIRKIIQKYLVLQQLRRAEVVDRQDAEQIQQIGYSRTFQRLKNLINIICHLYQFGSLAGDFVLSIVKHLVSKVTFEDHAEPLFNSSQERDSFNQDYIELISIIVQKIGFKLRNNDPRVLKQLIDDLKTLISKFGQQKEQSKEGQNSKIKYIDWQLNQIKLNKQKTSNTADQRMAFLYTFVNKNVPKEYGFEGKDKEVLALSFQEIKNANIEFTNWWQHVQAAKGGNNFNREGQPDSFEFDEQQNEEKQKLRQMAKQLRLVTQIRQKIFFILMRAQDYIQASQQIVQSKLKNLQEISTVLIKVCLSEKTFNPYYSLVASKIASFIPKFRVNIQFGVWDQLKQINAFELRQICNLAKFLAFIISEESANCSLTMLKYFPDLTDLSQNEDIFAKVFFREFFKSFGETDGNKGRCSKSYLTKLANKLQEQSNAQVRMGINEYLSEFVREEQKSQQGNSSSYLKVAKFFRKLLLIEKQNPRLQRD